MKGQLLLLALLVAAICTVDAERHRKRHRRLRTTTTTAAPAPAQRGDAEDENIDLGLAEQEDERRYQEAQRQRMNEIMNNADFKDVLPEGADPCLKVHCSAGRVCEIDEHGEAVCNCIKECPDETDLRRKVCTNHNETWSSDCEVYQQRCLCLDNSPLCRGPEFNHLQIEYYGECREMPECTESEMADFPRRMRDWLFNIMRDLAERRELSAHFQRMEREAEANLTRRWTNAAIWKWCDLDAHDNDRFVSKHELFPIRAPLMALEHCIAPFLELCDADRDHRITLAEWGKCLELDERHRKRHRRLRTTTTTAAPAPAQRGDAEDENIDLGLAEQEDERRYQEAQRQRMNEIMNNADFKDVLPEGADPCLKVHCSAGRVCEIDEHGEAVCNCIKECPDETDLRRKVCTNHNETWSSDCEVYQQRCLCLDNSPLCRGPEFNHLQIEYYGECREMPECTESEMADFPRRMRDWLFNIMRDLAERRELSAHFQRMEREAEANLTRRWTNAAIWKWCDLDAHDNDRFVSKHELFPIRAPLMALEHCIAPFLELCDADRDHRITLAEWGKCLELDETELEDRCDEFIGDDGDSAEDAAAA